MNLFNIGLKLSKKFIPNISVCLKNIKKIFQLKFDSPSLEQQFREYEDLHRLSSIRVAIAILIVLIMLFSRFDFEYGGDFWYLTFMLRMFGPIALLSMWFVISYSSVYQKNTRFYEFLFATAAMGATVFLSFSLGYLFDIPFTDWSFPFLANCMLIVFYTSLLLIISAFYFALFSLFIAIAFEVCLLQLSTDRVAITEINQNFAAAIVMALIANRGLEKLRRSVFQRNFTIIAERERANTLLYDLVPESVAKRLKNGEVVADEHHNLVVVFIDIVGFTQFSAHSSTEFVLDTLKAVFDFIDHCASKHQIEKVKTMGDGYMAVAHQKSVINNQFKHLHSAAEFCLEVIEGSNKIFADMNLSLTVRIGLDMGSAFGGVLGAKRPFYDYWGNTVNMAAHLEENSEPSRISVSSVIKESLAARFRFIDRGQVFLKGGGATHVWFLEHPLKQIA